MDAGDTLSLRAGSLAADELMRGRQLRALLDHEFARPLQSPRGLLLLALDRNRRISGRLAATREGWTSRSADRGLS
jgi:hypothetical protein